MTNLIAPPNEAAPGTGRTYKYFDLIMAAFVAVLLCANLIGVSKVTTVGGFTFGAGNIFFPISYLFGDVLTEVYGYARSRRVVWAGFAALAYASVIAFIVVNLPPAAGWEGQEHLAAVFGSTWRTAMASLAGYACGEFGNSYTLAKLKVRTNGKLLFVRTIGSTIVGEAIDTVVFYPLAFYGVWSDELLLKVMGANYVVKVLWEVFMTPVTYRVVAFLKRKEHEDYFDRDTNFTPFSLKT
ncbi:MAG: queuosine precursor transporter [Archangium sp.]|nr:queuosine precursor transporter [Archangium sp.]MDP3152421.1 queuosine precursor transporter [Archangium sp.]MDP3572409.1 queuosine precursor transporter [Archangium sp.]